MFYSKAWCNRNEVFHDEVKCKAFVVNWHNRTQDSIRNRDKSQMKRHTENQRLNAD